MRSQSENSLTKSFTFIERENDFGYTKLSLILDENDIKHFSKTSKGWVFIKSSKLFIYIFLESCSISQVFSVIARDPG